MADEKFRGSRRVPGGWAVAAGTALFSATSTAQEVPASQPSLEPVLEVIVTGSRIKRAEVEGPAPVTVITSEQMQREGFTTVYEALYSLSQSTGGNLQGQVFPGGATSNATTVDLRGLGPGRTLVLFNGRRAADYPLPFDGKSNIVNLSAVPTAALERIEVLSSGASAIYGSDAVAGVINFVMRDHFDGLEISARGGRLHEGGGESGRVQLTGGINGDAFRGVYAVEYFKREPIFALENRYFDSLADDRSGNGAIASGIAGLVSYLGGPAFIAATEADCAQFGRGAHVYDARAAELSAFAGPLCAGPDGQAQHTIRNDTESVSAFFNSTYDLGERLQAFGTLSLWQSDSGNTPQIPVWSGPGLGLVADVGPNANPLLGFDLIAPLRFFQLSEATREPLQKFDELAWDATLGLRGDLAGGRFSWESAYHHSDYRARRDRRMLVEQSINDYFLGPQLGTLPLLGFVWPVHAIADYSRFVRPLTPEQFRSLTAVNHTEANSSNDQFNVVVSGGMFELPAGSVEFAGTLEWGTQEYDIELDPREIANEFAGQVFSFPGGGRRDRYAAGLELAIPVLDQVRLTLAGRYDKYDDITSVDDAFTYNAGVEYRPMKSLLLRGSYATSFRAPDMHFVFAGSSNTYSTPTDELRCRQEQGVSDLRQCSINAFGVPTARQGNAELEEETGRSWTAGIAWNITDTLDISADYFDIQLENMVDDLTFEYLLKTEADCALGQTIAGQPVQTGTALCQFVNSMIERAAPLPGAAVGSLLSLSTLPINRALQSVSGIDTSLRYLFDAHRFGQFTFSMAWSHVLKEERQEFAADPIDSYRDDPRNHDLRSKIRGTLGWQLGGWRQTLFADRQGSRPAYAAANSAIAPSNTRTRPYTIYNYSASFASAADTWMVGLIVNNLLDADPKIDRSFSAYPFFYGQNVNPYGREVFLEASYRFK